MPRRSNAVNPPTSMDPSKSRACSYIDFHGWITQRRPHRRAGAQGSSTIGVPHKGDTSKSIKNAEMLRFRGSLDRGEHERILAPSENRRLR